MTLEQAIKGKDETELLRLAHSVWNGLWHEDFDHARTSQQLVVDFVWADHHMTAVLRGFQHKLFPRPALSIVPCKID